jgi:crotonobetainyl-CoA:carnitine CoA-transferase CaiB-like acyl-CoA transferase
VAVGAKRPEHDSVPMPPSPGFGDSIGAMTIAGGIMGALFHRERTGEATVVDVSLFATGLWAMGQAVALSLLLDIPWTAPPGGAAGNPLVRNYKTKDGRELAFTCLQAGQYWAQLCEIIGRPELATDERFADHHSLVANGAQAVEILTEVFASATVAEWRERLEPFRGQWTVVQDTLEAAADPQSVANGYIQECKTATGVPFKLVAAPVQYDEQPAVPSRAPEFNEHGDAILGELGLDWDTIVDLKVRGVVA